MINAWEERLIQCEIIKKEVEVEWDLEVTVIGKLTGVRGDMNWEEDENINKGIIKRIIIDATISTSPLRDSGEQSTVVEGNGEKESRQILFQRSCSLSSVKLFC